MTSWPAAGLAALAAWLIAFALASVLAWCGPVDRPRARGMHKAPTPTSGGLAIAGGTAAALLTGLATTRFGGGAQPALVAALILAFSHALLGAVDDVVDLGAKVKLLAQLVLALVFAVAVHPSQVPLWPGVALDLPPLIAVPGTALWLVVTINAVNFMDGSNGLIAGSLAVVLAGLGLGALAGGQPVLPVALLGAAAACLGFLPWNFPKARLFQGDAGALFLGALAAGVAVAAAGATRGRPLDLFAAPTALLPLLTDVLLTLLARARRRLPLLDAHRDHLYQRWLSAHGGDHAALAWRVWLVMAVYTAGAAVAALAAAPAPLLTFLVGLLIAIGGWLALDRGLRVKRSG